MPKWVDSQRDELAKRAGDRNCIPGAKPFLDSRILGCLRPRVAVARSAKFETREDYGAFHVGPGLADRGTSAIPREMRA